MRPELLDALRAANASPSTGESADDHRRRVMQLIEATAHDLTGDAGQACHSITLLGVGRGRDIDPEMVAQLFSEIHLVDADEPTVHQAAENFPSAANVTIHAPADVAEPLLSLTPDHVDPEDDVMLAEILQRLSSENGLTDVPQVDVVVSLCVLGQLLGSLRQIVGADHDAWNSLLQAIRMGHLRRMLNMVRDGGVAILVTDVALGDAAAEFGKAQGEEVAAVVRRLIDREQVAAGLSPKSVIRDLNILSRLPHGPESLHSLDPWPLQTGPLMSAVYALRFQKKLPEKVEEMPHSERPS